MRKPSEVLIWIDGNGAARELTDAEKAYVDAEFSPFDGARPFIKTRYRDHNGWGELSGYLPRTEVPDSVPISPASPAKQPEEKTPQAVAKEIAELIRKHRPT